MFYEPFPEAHASEIYSIECRSCGDKRDVDLEELVPALLAWECPKCGSTTPPPCVDRGGAWVQ
jgi:Zn finger protein HypA/HybF involved in hydrogenase expression